MPEFPYDERFNVDDLFRPVRTRSLRRLPSLLVTSAGIVREAAPKEFAATAVLQAVFTVGVAAQVLLGRKLLTVLLALGKGSSGADVIPWLIAFTTTGAVLAFSSVVRTERQRLLGELVSRHATGKVLDIASSVDLLAFETPVFHNRLQRARVNAAVRPTQMVGGALSVASAILGIVAVSFALLLIEPILLILVILAYVPLWFAVVRASRAEYRFAVEQTERDRRREHLSDVLSRRDEAAELRAFGHVRFIRSKYEDLYDERVRDLRLLVGRRTKFGFLGTFANSLLNVGAIALLSWFVTSRRLSLADAGAATGALLLLAQRLSALASGSGSLYESSLFMDDYTSFLSVHPVEADPHSSPGPSAGFDRLVARDLSFSYPSRSTPAVQNVSLTIERGQVIALVGENGSGKTTLAKILGALYAPMSGSIEWDGTAVDQLDRSMVRDTVGVIFQDFVKYLLTVRQNVTVGRIEHMDDHSRFSAAAQRASALEFLEQLDDGVDTQLGTEYAGGVGLSTGQWQRIAIARGFFRDAPFLILDEPTSSLDARSEAELFENIRQLYRGRTVLLISHRFSTVRSADQIYVMKAGRIVEHGTHDELMHEHGLYAELFMLQASAFLDEVAPECP